ncbi:hypothetical protein [Deinococcus roseus]|uniref:MFS transporter n=1 Tax=Deinococcus roseus TaxID=392414 RepID=A0ABQ2D3K1_9DEIO|nr:hypothetical protein [Deinococcus roseus]GGJ44834.1 hypothetical protein GCM10008938_33820 [Deinococcus roseus]
MNAEPQKLRWAISTLHFFAIANLAAGTMLLVTGHGIIQGLVAIYPVLGLLTYNSIQLSCMGMLLTSALLCEVAAQALKRKKTWAWMLAFLLLVLMALGWSAGGVTLLVAGTGLYSLLDSRVRQWLNQQEAHVPVLVRSKTVRLD